MRPLEWQRRTALHVRAKADGGGGHADPAEASLRRVIGSPARYVGMIGSRYKCEVIMGHLRADGIGEKSLARVHAPIGLDLGGATPEEIAVSILAEIIAVRRRGKAVVGRT